MNVGCLAHHMVIESIAVLGAGQMGNGITQVAACAGYDVVMIDIKQDYVDKGLAAIKHSLNRVVSKERMTQDEADAALARISISTTKSSAADGASSLVRALLGLLAPTGSASTPATPAQTAGAGRARTRSAQTRSPPKRRVRLCTAALHCGHSSAADEKHSGSQQYVCPHGLKTCVTSRSMQTQHSIESSSASWSCV